MPNIHHLRIVVTAGPTWEPIDAVRFISNPSTGLMGYTIAQAARQRGHQVRLLSGPTHLAAPAGVETVRVTTAREMATAVARHFPWCQCLIMTSAISDFRPEHPVRRKIKKREVGRSPDDKSSGRRWQLALVENPDILERATRRKGDRIVVGFAVETERLVPNAMAKWQQKRLDFIVANLAAKGQSPFGRRPISGVLIDNFGMVAPLRHLSKEHLAAFLIERIEQVLEQRMTQRRLHEVQTYGT